MRLPLELVDEIIDEACAVLPAWPIPRKSTLKLESSLALVSRAFRQRTNIHRFAHVPLIECGERYHPSLHVDMKTFLPILQSDVWTQHTGVARHIRKVELCWECRPHTLDLFDDGHIEEILNIIFREMPNGNRPARTLILGTYPGDWTGWLITILTEKMDWREIDPDFLFTLQGLLKKNSNLIRLELEGFENVPLAFLTTSRITHLSLRNVTFESPKQGCTPARLELGQLHHLEALELYCEELPSFTIGKPGQFKSLKNLTINVDPHLPDYCVTGEELSLMLPAILGNVTPACELEISLHYFSAEEDQITKHLRDILIENDYNYAPVDGFLDDYSYLSCSTIILRFTTTIIIEWVKDPSYDFQAFFAEAQCFFEESFPLMNKGGRRKVLNFKKSEERMRRDGLTTLERVFRIDFSVLFYVD